MFSFMLNGVEIVLAYGNAKSDARAFINTGILVTQSVTIGPDVAHANTSPILDNSYLTHIQQRVAAIPAGQLPVTSMLRSPEPATGAGSTLFLTTRQTRQPVNDATIITSTAIKSGYALQTGLELLAK